MTARPQFTRLPANIDGIIAPARSGTIDKGNKRRSHALGMYGITIGASALILLLGGLLGYWLHRPQQTVNPHLSGSGELKAVEKAVSKHYLLPLGEVPALATVTDKNKLTSPFFKDVEDGDKLLIYQQNKIAVIYRPSIDRIVAVGPVSIDNTAGQ